MYKLIISLKVQCELKKIPKRYQKAIIAAIKELKDYPDLGKPLERELTRQFSLRVGVYRVLYKINQKNKTLTILTAGHRSTIYS